jgi:two-component system NarL family response regulator
MVVDDHPIWRDAIERDLRAAGLDVVAAAGDGEQALRRMAAARPDVVVLDLRLPVLDGVETTRRIAAEHPGVRVLVLSASGEEGDVLSAIKAGATGYLLKEISVEEVAEAIQAVVQGQSLITPSMASKLLVEFQKLSTRTEDRAQYPSPTLTTRELEVLKLVAKGMSNREIADELFISDNTVKNHVRNILEKLHLHSRMEAVIYAVRERLLDIRDDA